MRNKRVRIGDRRQLETLPRVPFKDSNGVIVRESRRQIPDRRLDGIQAEWIDEIVLD